MGLKLAGFLLQLLLVLPVRGTDLSRNGTLPEDTRGPRTSRRVVRLYSGTRPKPIVCQGEGFQADPTDCSIFHRCMKNGNGRYVSFRFQCGPGTIYDPVKEICNHPQSTKRTECGASTYVPSLELPFDNEISRELPSPLSTKHPESTEKTTTKRLDTSSFASKHPWVSKPVVTTFNSFFSQQQHTKSAKPSSIKREATASSYLTTPLAPQKLLSTTAKIDFQNSATSSISGDICTTNGFMGDSENCRKFYRCISNQRGGYIRYEFLCTDPTIWDDDKQACNHVWAVKRRRCGRGSFAEESHETLKNKQETLSEYTSTSQTTSLLTQSQLQINYGSKITQTQTQISNGPVIQNQTQINFGNGSKNIKPSVVQNQTQISHGDAVSQTQTQINYGDEAVQAQLQIDHSKESSQAQTQVSQLSSTTKTTKFNEYQPVSSTSSNNGCTESGFMGDSEDCRKFYRCVDTGRGSFTRYEFSCGEGTVWDSKIEACNHAWAVKECGGKASSDSTTQSSIKTTQSTTRVFESLSTLSTTTTTQSYYSSTETESDDDNDIPYGNQPTSPSTNKPTEQVTSENKDPPSLGDNKCRSSGFMGDNKDCKKFYRCVDNGNRGYTRYEFTCGEGTVWDQSIEACNHAWAVEKCGGNANMLDHHTEKSTTINVTYPTTTQTTSQIPLQNDDYDTGYGQQSLHDEPSSTVRTTTVKSTTTTLQTLSPSDTSIGNVCTSSGFMGDNVDCKKFYRCVGNGNGGYTMYEFSCGEGTVWDPKIQACNHAWAVKKCGGNSVEDINKVETTTQKENVIPSSSTSQAYEPDENHDPGYGQQSQEPKPVSSTPSHQENQSSGTNECKNSGFMGDSNDCKKFYRCVYNGDGTFTRFEFSCGEGTVWDSKIDACNHAWAVEKCGGTSTSSTFSPTQLSNEDNSGIYPIQSDEYPTQTKPSAATSTTSTTTTTSPNTDKICKNSGFMGDTQDCKRFFRCVDDGHGGYTRYEFSCGEGTVWDHSIEACNHAWAVRGRCSGSGNYNDSSDVQPTTQTYTTSSEKEGQEDKTTTQKTSTSMESTTKASELSTPNNEDTHTSQKPQSAEIKCESEGFHGDPNDCKKFYRCVNNGKGDFTKYEFTCGVGTIWDQEILSCNHESGNNKCSANNVNHSAMPELETGSSETTQQSQMTSRPGTASTVSGNDQCSMEGFFANTNDCKKFYRCVDNGKDGFTKYDFTCGEGTIWLQEIQACDYENDISSCSNADSSSKPQTVEVLQSTTKFSSTSQATTESQSLDKEDDEYPSASSTEAPKTNEKCTSEGFFGNKNDCTRFYRCVDNGQGGYAKYDFTCGEGTAWDSNIQTCNHISEVENCQKSNEGSLSKPSQDEGVSKTTESTSTTKETSSSSPSSSNTDKCEQEGYFGNSKDCTLFYRCVDNGKGDYTKYDFTCGEGTIWDQDITVCNHPQDVTNPSCKNGGDGQSSSENSSTTESSSSTSSSSTDSQSSQGTAESSNQDSNCTQDSSTKKPGSQKVKCEKAGFYADPNDCKKFYRCVDWDGDGKRFSVYHFDCGEGTIWDPQLETCNHEDSVYPPRDCSGTHSQSENGTQETTSSSSTTTTEKSTTPDQSTTTESTTTTQSTTEEMTTQQSSSSSGQTTQQSTMTEKTTTQQPSTSEQTTTTTQQSTSSEKTTTKQSTTTEKTTTQLTTSEQTTTEQTTTNQQQTTQESTTSQPTSTQQTTTSEHTTTEQTTTSEQNTSEQTTQQTMTSEQTTQSSSSEQTTSQSSTTEDSNTDSTTTEQQSPTTEQSSTTTEQNTTEQQVTTEQEKTTTEDSTTTTESSESTTTESNQGTTSQETSSPEKDCPETEEDQYLFVCPTSFRRHPKYCNMFYQCTEDNDSHDVKIAMFKCPNNTIYDESKTQCVDEDKADKKCDGQTAQRHRVKRLNSNFKEPIEASLRKHTCTAAGYYPFETDNECSGIFLKCQTTKSGKLRGYVYRCPEGYTYWSISKRCEKKQYMKGCKQSDRNWRDRWEIPIEKKNIAK